MSDEPEILLLREMSPAKKLSLMNSLIRQAFRLKMAAIRASDPDLSETQVLKQLQEAWSGD